MASINPGAISSGMWGTDFFKARAEETTKFVLLLAGSYCDFLFSPLITVPRSLGPDSRRITFPFPIFFMQYMKLRVSGRILMLVVLVQLASRPLSRHDSNAILSAGRRPSPMTCIRFRKSKTRLFSSSTLAKFSIIAAGAVSNPMFFGGIVWVHMSLAYLGCICSNIGRVCDPGTGLPPEIGPHKAALLKTDTPASHTVCCDVDGCTLSTDTSVTFSGFSVLLSDFDTACSSSQSEILLISKSGGGGSLLNLTRFASV